LEAILENASERLDWTIEPAIQFTLTEPRKTVAVSGAPPEEPGSSSTTGGAHPRPLRS
jgi:hypothetical protein